MVIAAVAVVGCGCSSQGDRQRGEQCRETEQCRSELRCIDLQCRSAQDIQDMHNKRVAEEERRMLANSGVKPVAEAPASEAGLVPAAPGLPIRVARVSGRDRVFASCRADERLVSGGCTWSQGAGPSFPSGYKDGDTVGARWNCHRPGDLGGLTIDAYALCQRLTVAEGAPTSAPDAGAER